jgi:hypothetical protein
MDAAWGNCIGDSLLSACQPGNLPEWCNGEAHTYCTGAHHVAYQTYVRCTCSCHNVDAASVPSAGTLVTGSPALSVFAGPSVGVVHGTNVDSVLTTIEPGETYSPKSPSAGSVIYQAPPPTH